MIHSIYQISFQTRIGNVNSMQKLHDCLKKLNIKHWSYDFQDLILTLRSEVTDFQRIEKILNLAGYHSKFLKLEHLNVAWGLSVDSHKHFIMKHLYLALAIISEVIATSALNASQQFTKWIPSAITIIGYLLAFYFLSLTLRTMPVGIAYAIWSGVGIVLTTVIGIFMFKQVPDFPAIIGIMLIIAGVLVMNIFSKTTGHWKVLFLFRRVNL